MLIRTEQPADALAVERLYLAAFGPGQFAKAASLLRAGNTPVGDACRVAEDGDGALIGACRIWPLVSEGGPCVLLGPIAVEAARRKDGVGEQLARACLAACDRLGVACVVLVGDLAYFGKFGFAVVPGGTLSLPAPADPARLLWRVASEAQLPSGLLRAAGGRLRA
ncbi:MAG: N-acetyltransferase [Hyphomonadaceae bacterium]|jgi:predicted N-acetyltransferase YhbS|nr:N-acetyltransferase [Hyphomonadaceae bacterium]